MLLSDYIVATAGKATRNQENTFDPILCPLKKLPFDNIRGVLFCEFFIEIMTYLNNAHFLAIQLNGNNISISNICWIRTHNLEKYSYLK